MQRLIENRQLASIITMFLIVQFGGLLVLSLLVSSSQFSVISGSAANSTISVVWYFAYIVVAAMLILLITKYIHGDILFIIIEAVAIISASFFVFLIVLSYFFSNVSATALYAASLILAVLLVIAKNRMPYLRNTLAIIASIGIGVILGINFSFLAALFFMALIAIYDYVAVFITKHMITLAQGISSRNLAFLIGSSDVEAMPKENFTKNELRSYDRKTMDTIKKNPYLSRIVKQGKLPVVSQVQLGAGDLGIPLMVAVSAFATFGNYFTSIVIAIGAGIGLIATMWFLRKYQRPLPAIPPLFSFICFALGVEFIISQTLFAVLLIAIGAFTMFFGIVWTLRKGAK